MLSVLIVDDEMITRKGLKSHVNWEKLKIDKIYDSGNPAEALEIVQKVKPDLILSDVCMPGMNGIEMCTKIREIHKDCQIIFLSGYSDKEYLKGAIRLEAVNYVEKPISISEVEEALASAVDKQLKNKRKKERIRQLVTENHSMTEKRLIERLSMPNAKSENLRPDFAKLRIDWCEMDEFAVTLYRLYPRDGYGADSIVREIRQDFSGFHYIYSVKEYRYLIFICAFSKREEGTLSDLAGRIQQRMLGYGQAPYYCVVGESVSSVETIYESYQSAVIKMQQMCFWNKARFGMAQSLSEDGLKFDEQILSDFTQAVKQYNEENAIKAIGQLYIFMQRQQNVMVSHIKGAYFRFIETLFQKAEFTVGKSDTMDAAIVGMIWEKLHEIDNLEACQHYLMDETKNYFKNVEELAKNNQTIITIISFIQANYRDTDLCLENIAENVYLSPNYLSSLFKKKMDKTISQYIADVRVQHARELLRDRSLKLYDVAVQAGYKDANYFTKIFKKAVGVTPSEYREKYNI